MRTWSHSRLQEARPPRDSPGSVRRRLAPQGLSEERGVHERVLIGVLYAYKTRLRVTATCAVGG